MTANESTEVEQLVERKIAKHSGDTHKSLVMEATGQLDATIDSSAKSRGEAQFEETQASTPSGSVPSGSTPSGYEQMETIQYEQSEERSRYSLTKMHGEGGVGRVWQAHDQRLNRQVALKEIRPDRETSKSATRRFAKEAQITSQLEHPNIVPVYELSGDPESARSFYTMRFVRGDTFRTAIDTYHRHRREGKATELELRELLHSFIAICNALGYAHSRGVVHRDLKPSNVMVGSFGEVVVLDWGLAKMVDQVDDDDEHLLESGPISVTEDVQIDATMQGAVLGTLPYMAPEQAAGRIDRIDARTDVYGLGAILYAVLTGNHPHRGTSTREVRSQILNEPTPRVRAENSKVHPGLDAICARAMAKKRSERYVKAGELAEDVRRWLADEPLECYPESTLVKAGRWLRRHRTWAQSIAAALLIVTCISIAAVLIVDRARRAESQAKKDAQDSFVAEQQAKAEATQRFEEARDAVDTMMTGVSEVLAYFPGMQSLREQLLTQAVERYEQFAADKSDDPELQSEAARAMIRLGDVFRGLSKYDLARSTYEEAATRMQALAVGASNSQNARIQLASAKAKLGVLNAELGDLEQAVSTYDESIQLYDELLWTERDPTLEHERAGVVVNRAMLLDRRGLTQDALAQLNAAAETFKVLAKDPENPAAAAGLAMTAANIANVLVGTGQNSEALPYADDAIARYSELATKYPDHPPYLEALATTRLNLAAAYRTSGRDREELAMYEAALSDYDLLVASRSDVPVYRERQAGTERELAAYLHALGDNRTAHEAIQAAIQTTEALLSTQVPLAAYHEQWALEQATLGRILGDSGREEEALLHLNAAIERYDALIDSDPDYSTSYKAQRAASRSALGVIYQKTRDIDEALATLEQAAAEFKEISTENSAITVYQNGLAWTYSHLADLLWQMEEPAVASDYFEKARQIQSKLVDEPEHLNSLARMIVASRAPEFEPAMGQQALKAAQQATSVAPENARYKTTLGSVYARLGQFDEAIETLRAVDNLVVRGGTTHDFWLAYVLAKRGVEGDTNEARNRFQQAVTRMELHAPSRGELVRLRKEIEPMLADSAAPSPKP